MTKPTTLQVGDVFYINTCMYYVISTEGSRVSYLYRTDVGKVGHTDYELSALLTIGGLRMATDEEKLELMLLVAEEAKKTDVLGSPFDIELNLLRQAYTIYAAANKPNYSNVVTVSNGVGYGSTGSGSTFAGPTTTSAQNTAPPYGLSAGSCT